MLPLSFFSNPGFTVASVGVGLVFFAMMGSVFAFTQYLQFAVGFSALEAGAAMLALDTFGLALAMGAAMAPATDSVMSVVPDAKAGVGSAMSDVTRQVGGALGVAQQVGGTAGSDIADTAGRAFTDALGIGLTTAAVAALAGAVLVLLRLPSGRAPAITPDAARPHVTPNTPTGHPVTHADLTHQAGAVVGRA
jgi:hypothetical protein